MTVRFGIEPNRPLGGFTTVAQAQQGIWRAHRKYQWAAAGRYFPNAPTYPDWGAGYLDYVAAELNNQPARRLGWKTHAEALNELLPSPETHLLLQ